MQFFKNVLSSCLGAFLAMVLIGVLFFAIVASIASKEEPALKNNSILHLKLEGEINELQADDPLAGLPLPGVGNQNTGLMQLKETIDHAKDDPKIKGIYLEVNRPITLFASLEEIRESLKNFKESGKKVIAYNEVMSEGAYYLASVADKVYLNPEGEVEFNGLTSQFVSFKKLLDKLEIKPEVFRVGEFKSAVEPFLYEEMSNENRLQMQEMINSIYSVMLQRISESRNIPVERLEEISDNMLVRNAHEAVSYGLIDSLMYKDQFNKVLKQQLGIGEDTDASLVTYSKYRKSFSTYSSSNNEIAVIVAEGTIMPGENNQSDPMIGADTFVEEIRKARKNDHVKAIVMRVNSPGGEFRASDMIWREVYLAAQEKPVIASMGDLAASGGYYISMACDTIVAEPNTITGSIGIFGIMFDMSDFLEDKIGITFDEVKTGKFGEMYTITRPLTDAEKRYWQKTLDENYRTFVGKAAQGRNMDTTEIKKVAAGRVWTGIEAKDKGLVDIIGGFNDAVKIAAEKANISGDYKIRYYPKRKSFYELLLEEAADDAKVKAMKQELGDQYVLYKKWSSIKEYQGAQARLPYEFSME